MINNLETIKPRLKQVFDLNRDDLFFHLLLIQRKKENEEMINKNTNVVKTYVVKDIKYLEHKLEKEIIPICNNLNARAMINLNPKSFRRVTHSMLRRLSEYIESNFYDRSISKLFDSCTASSSVDKEIGIEKHWILDVDKKESVYYIETLKSIINQHCCPIYPKGDKVKLITESKNGYHLITTPFNIKDFERMKNQKEYKEYLKEVEVKKDCLTNLYIK